MICTYLNAFHTDQDKLFGLRSSSNGAGVAMARVRRLWKLPFRILLPQFAGAERSSPRTEGTL
ncbi:hypothetical protein SAMN04488039_1011182 [Sulfitobacter dubius]|nr:hypothetical protein SAMN04488039_1011182 [Sulfitobacter dubius]